MDEKLEDSFERQPSDPIMDMLKRLEYSLIQQDKRMSKIEGDLTGISNRQSIAEYEQAQDFTPKKRDNERRSSLATRDLGKLLEAKPTSQIIHTPQSFKLNNKLGDILKFSEYRDLVQQVKRFKTRPGNAEVDIFLYREEYMNDALRAWMLTRLHLYYGSERARAIGEYHQYSSAELTNMESLEFLCVLEKAFVATNKEEYRKFFKKIVEEVKQRASCKVLTIASFRYLIADFEMFSELMNDALVVNPEKVQADTTYVTY